MTEQAIKTALISDFNIQNLGGYLSNSDMNIEIVDTPYGQVFQLLMDANHDVWQQTPDVAIVWTQPQGISQHFDRLMNYEPVDTDDILAEVDQFAAQILMMKDRVKTVFVPAWVLPTYHRGAGMLNMQNGIGLRNVISRMNIRLADHLSSEPDVFILDTQQWIEEAGAKAYNIKFWYMGKIAFGTPVFKIAAQNITAALRGLRGGAKKLIVLDLDDTLWGGIVGDAGWENLQLGGHDPVGEAFVHFQQVLKSLKNRGIVLGIVSKNTEEVALEAIDKHPEMVLRRDDFAGWRINWNDKAQNVLDLVKDINLGLQSVVFLDDNPVERARVREMLPEVLVPEWPEDKMLYATTLLSMDCFDVGSISAEDSKRAEMYTTERKRKALQENVTSIDEWLQTLEVRVQVEPLLDANKERTVQLLNKTNQLNLTTRRLSEAELVHWVEEAGRHLWTFRVSDKFGDQGLTGIASLDVQGDRAQIVEFILSCRVMGRKVEETMLATVIEAAKQQGAKEVYAKYLETPKNKPVLDFFKRSGLDYDETNQTFTWNTDNEYAFPPQLSVQRHTEPVS